MRCCLKKDYGCNYGGSCIITVYIMQYFRQSGAIKTMNVISDKIADLNVKERISSFKDIAVSTAALLSLTTVCL